MNGEWLAMGAVAALAAAGAVRRGSRNSEIDWERVNLAIDLVPELRARILAVEQVPEDDWIEIDGTRMPDPDLVEGFHLTDHGRHVFQAPRGWGLSPDVRHWWKRRTGMDYLGHGNYRLTSRMPDGRVLKLALDHWGERANYSETDTWERLSADPQVAGFLVPVLAGSDLFVVMDYAAPIRPIDQSELERRQRRWNDLLHEGRGGAVDDTSISSNWGRHQGLIKLVDYEESY